MFFLGDVVIAEEGRFDDVGEDFDAALVVWRRHSAPVSGAFAVGEGVDHAADAFDDAADVARAGASGRSLEEHVLEEM